MELFCDYAPSRRFGKVGMELFDLREHDREEVLQTVMDRGTTKYQLTYDDRALQFFRTFVESTEKANYFEIPSADSWVFIPDKDTFIRTPPLSIIRKAGLLPFSRSSILSPAKLSHGKRCCVHRTASLLAPILPGWQGMIFISPTCTVSASRCLWRVN